MASWYQCWGWEPPRCTQHASAHRAGNARTEAARALETSITTVGVPALVHEAQSEWLTVTAIASKFTSTP